LKEYCVMAGEEYEITGTCVNNPHSSDFDDHSMIARGRDEKTFEISDKPDGQVEYEHWHRAMMMIFGGAAVALGCLALLLMMNKLH
jgi:hypothetical protein